MPCLLLPAEQQCYFATSDGLKCKQPKITAVYEVHISMQKFHHYTQTIGSSQFSNTMSNAFGLSRKL